MREFRIRYGDNSGSHWIYDSVTEFEANHPEKKYIRWDQQIDFKNIKTGDWVEAEDGFIVQVIKTAVLTDRKNGGEVFVIRFPMASMKCYNRKTKPPRVPQFFASMVHRYTYTATGNKNFTGNDARKIVWGQMVLMGADPIVAYRTAFKDQKYHTTGAMMSKILNLINDPKVRSMVMSYLRKFSLELKKKISDQDLVDAVAEYWTNVKKGSKDQLAVIKMVHDMYKEADKIPGMGMAGTLPQHTNPLEIEEGSYEEVDPPIS